MRETNLDCCVVRDLLPSYLEELTETETSAMVREHIEHCAACRQLEEDIRSGRRSSPERLPRRRPIASATKRRCAGRRASTPFSLPPTQTASISITIFTTILLRWIVPGSSGISSARPALCGGSRIGCVWKMTCP